MRKYFSYLVVASCSLSALCIAWCADQKFTVQVPANISITSPSNASLTHDESDNNQAFPGQTWLVKGNVQNGVSVSFATNQAFTHETDANFKRDARLNLAAGAKQGPATWTVTKAVDTTDYTNGDGIASVTAASNGVGRSEFNLTVTFITDSFGTFAAGNYETTVTGTVTAN